MIMKLETEPRAWHNSSQCSTMGLQSQLPSEMFILRQGLTKLQGSLKASTCDLPSLASQASAITNLRNQTQLKHSFRLLIKTHLAVIPFYRVL